MMDVMSSTIDAGLTFAGVLAVVLMGMATLSSESTTVSATSQVEDPHSGGCEHPGLRRAA